MSDSRIEDFIKKINSSYDGSVCELGGRFKALKMRRFSSGILSLDTGKTLIALKAVEQVEKYDHNTKLHVSEVDPSEFSAGRALFVDLEGSFDLDWAKANGFNGEHHVVARPEYAEQAVDIVTDAIRQNVFDLIIIDSIANMTPTAEIEESTGGKGQEFCSSVIVYTKSPKIEDGDDKETAFVEMGGTTHKNKTFVPKLNYSFKMSLKAQPGWDVGQVDNSKQLLKLGKQTGAIVVEKNKVICGKLVTKTQKELVALFDEDDGLKHALWGEIIKRMIA